MARSTRARQRAAARKGWRTRRARVAKRSDAAKKGWRTRRARRPKKPPKKPPKYRDYLIVFGLHSAGQTRLVDFIAEHFISEKHATAAVWRYIAEEGDHEWMEELNGWSVRVATLGYSAASRAHVEPR